MAYDSTQATASNRVKMYINGEQITSFSTETYPPQNTDSYFNTNANLHTIGRATDNTASFYLDGYLTAINLIDGQALTPSDFGDYNATTGVWQPIEYTGTYGTNGFYLPMNQTVETMMLLILLLQVVVVEVVLLILEVVELVDIEQQLYLSLFLTLMILQ